MTTNYSTRLVLAQVQDLQVGHLRGQVREVRHQVDLVVVEVQRLQLRNVLADDLEGLRHERGPEQGAEDVQQVRVRVEFGQVQGLGLRVVSLHHGQLHALHHRIVHIRLRHIVRHDDAHLVAGRHLDLAVRIGEFLGRLQVVHVEDGRVVQLFVVVGDEHYGPDVLQQQGVDVGLAHLGTERDLHLEPARGARGQTPPTDKTLATSAAWWG